MGTLSLKRGFTPPAAPGASAEVPPAWPVPLGAGGVILLDADDRIRGVNGNLQALLGYGADDLVGTPLAWLLPPRLQARPDGWFVAQLAMRSSVPGQRRLRLRRYDGQAVRVCIGLLPTSGDAKHSRALLLQPYGVVPALEAAVPLPRTRRADTRERARVRRLRRRVHCFADDVAHEFRTPLAVIKEFAALLGEGLVGTVSPEQACYLEKIQGRVGELAGLIDDMLDISRLKAGLLGGQRRVGDVAELVAAGGELWQTRAQQYGHRLETEVPANLPAIFCDPQMITRVITNLTHNALKYARGEGAVRIWARSHGDGSVHIGVSDTGPGIDPTQVARLFKRFRQTAGARARGGGFGLGLNIVRELVRLNLGTLDVASDVGQGTTFSFTVPCATVEAVLARYAAVIPRDRRDGALTVAVMTAVGTAETDPERLDQAIQRLTRRSDLVLRAAGREWVVLSAGGPRELAALTERVKTGLAESARMGQASLRLVCTVLGTWARLAQSNGWQAAARRALANGLHRSAGCARENFDEPGHPRC